MEKINEQELNAGYFYKRYKDESVNNILELIDKVRNNMIISEITIEEDVEMDMQTYDGIAYYIEGFINAYSSVLYDKKDLSFVIEGYFNGSRVYLSIYNNNDNLISLLTDSPCIELDNIYDKKTP